MMFYKKFIILTLFSLTIVRLGKSDEIECDDEGYDKDQLNKFLYHIQEIEGMRTTTVMIDQNRMSLDDFFVTSYEITHPDQGKPTIPDKWTITTEGIHRTGYMLHILVSCKYTELTYHWLKLIEELNKGKLNEVLVKSKIKKNKEVLFKPLERFLKSMIMTLVGLLKYTQNYAAKQHEILTVFLSWYMYINNYILAIDENDSEEKLEYRLKSIIVANFQVERYLKQFMLHNCQSYEEFERFKSKVNEDMNGLYLNNMNRRIKEKEDELSKLTFTQFVSIDKVKLYILTSNRENSENLISLIKQQMQSKNIKLNWDLSIAYDRYYAETSSDIKSVLKFERIILQTITEIIIGYVSNILKTIKENSNEPAEVNTKCNDLIVKVLDKYIDIFENRGQPSYLINHMSIIKTDLWTVCFNNKSIEEKKSRIDNHIKKIDELKTGIEIEAAPEQLEKFLNSLSKIVICTLLNPLVSNAFWDKLYFSPTSISEYVIDFKYINIKNEVLEDRSGLCTKISEVSSNLDSISKKIKECEKAASDGNTVELKKQFGDLKTLYNQLKTEIEKTVLITDGVFRYSWKKLLLTVDYNLDVAALLESEVDEFNLEKLKSLQDHILDYFDIGYKVTCDEASILKVDHQNFFDSLTSNFRTPSDSKHVKKFNDVAVDSYKEFFKHISSFMVEFSVKSKHIDDKLRLFWDGFYITLEDAHKLYTKYTIDVMQINYEYLRFLVRWIVAVTYTSVMDVFAGLINFEKLKFEMSAETPGILEEKFRDLLKLPLLIEMPVKQTLDIFVDTLKSYDGTDKSNMIRYNKYLYDELENLGVDMRNVYKTAENVGFDERIKSLIEVIEYTVELFKKHEAPVQEAMEKFGINQGDLIMMFGEWHRE